MALDGPPRDTLREDQIYWTTNVSQESANHDDDTPRKPWQGKLEIVAFKDGSHLYLHSYNKLTGEMDYDSNATAFCGTNQNPTGLFNTKKEAVKHYLHQMTKHIKFGLEDLTDLLGDLEEEIEKFVTPDHTLNNQLVVLFDGIPLVVINAGQCAQDTSRILNWYAEKYAMEISRLTCTWVGHIDASDTLKEIGL